MREAGFYFNQPYLSFAESKSAGHASDLGPDVYKYSAGLNVSEDFVICRDKFGEPTALYGWHEWDFRPYRLAATGNCVINFRRICFDLSSSHEMALLSEAKVIIFSLIYFCNAGAAGALSVSTIYKYFSLVVRACQYCIRSRSNRMLGALKLSDLFSNPVYLAAFVRSIGSIKVGDRRQMQALHALLRHLNVIGEHVLGYRSVTDVVVHERVDHQQHPLIPARIYLENINFLTERVSFLKENTLKLELFMRAFSDHYYGLSRKVQRRNHKVEGLSRFSLKPTFEEAIAEHGMGGLFNHPDFNANGRAKLVGVLSRIQYEMKSIIHLYTGMRFDEVNRLPYDCIIKGTIDERVMDEYGNTISRENIVELLSTTTKFTGFRKEDSWFAHEVVIDAVTVLQRVARGYADYVGADVERFPLFVSTVKLFMKNYFSKERVEVTVYKDRAKSFENDSRFIITREDYEILQASDPERDFSSDERFQVGKPWPFTSHQYRRSLAFYAANSGFVSLPTLMRQFKHLAQQITKYYSRNNQNIKTIFGHYDFERKVYVLPISHISYELQVGMSLEAAEMILADLLDKGATLYGKEGGYLERARKRLESGEVLVEEFKEDTVKRLRNGEISYRKTLLGGCTNIDVCECSILGEFSQCLDSKCAVIKSSSVDSLIDSTRRELECYEKDSVEYLATKDELESLLKFRSKKMGVLNYDEGFEA